MHIAENIVVYVEDIDDGKDIHSSEELNLNTMSDKDLEILTEDIATVINTHRTNLAAFRKLQGETE